MVWNGRTQKKDTNPMRWASIKPIMCSGQFQSPIALDSNSATYLGAESEAVVDISVGSSVKKASDAESFTTTNNGHSLAVAIPKGTWQITLNTKAKNYYEVSQFHFHWGSVNTRGSEHTLDNKSFPLEMHIVTYPHMYANLSEAHSAPGGLAVIGVFFKLTPDQSKSSLSKMGNLLSKIGEITTAGSNVKMSYFNPERLLPQNRKEFFRYQGSLTTPPCTENVQWTVMRQALDVTEADLKQLRSIHFGVDDDAKLMQDNFRPLQPLNAVLAPQPRMLYKSWPSTAGRIAPALFVLTLHLTIITFSN
uniref:Carbonic anhydrase n=1 Tax=Schistocephalus solidus TaxID=70667 RepID=A0A0X3PUJ7_SCHSO